MVARALVTGGLPKIIHARPTPAALARFANYSLPPTRSILFSGLGFFLENPLAGRSPLLLPHTSWRASNTETSSPGAREITSENRKGGASAERAQGEWVRMRVLRLHAHVSQHVCIYICVCIRTCVCVTLGVIGILLDLILVF